MRETQREGNRERERARDRERETQRKETERGREREKERKRLRGFDPCITTTHLSNRFSILETYATAYKAVPVSYIPF